MNEGAIIGGVVGSIIGPLAVILYNVLVIRSRVDYMEEVLDIVADKTVDEDAA